jgi:hypothetical protein
VVLKLKAQLKESLSTEFMARSVKHAAANHWLQLRSAHERLLVGCQHSAAPSTLLYPPYPTKVMVPFMLHCVSLWKLHVRVAGLLVRLMDGLPTALNGTSWLRDGVAVTPEKITAYMAVNPACPLNMQDAMAFFAMVFTMFW